MSQIYYFLEAENANIPSTAVEILSPSDTPVVFSPEVKESDNEGDETEEYDDDDDDDDDDEYEDDSDDYEDEETLLFNKRADLSYLTSNNQLQVGADYIKQNCVIVFEYD